MSRVAGRAGAVVAGFVTGLVGLGQGMAPARAQDVIYSESRNGVHSRYEQFGQGPNAYVRYRSRSVSPLVPTGMAPVRVYRPGSLLGGVVDTPRPGVVGFHEDHERYGPAPRFGTFYGGLAGPVGHGYSPGELFQMLGDGARGRGVSQSLAYLPDGTVVPLLETRYDYPDPKPAIPAAPAPAQVPARPRPVPVPPPPAPGIPAPAAAGPGVAPPPPPPPIRIDPKAPPAGARPPKIEGPVPPPPGPGLPPLGP